MSENITPRLKNVLKNARKEAVKIGNDYVGLEHVVLAIIEINSGLAAEVLKKTKIEVNTIKHSLINAVTPKEKSTLSASSLPSSKELDECFIRARKVSDKFSHQYIGTEHFLISILEDAECTVVKVFKTLGINTDNLRTTLSDELGSKSVPAPQKVTAGGDKSEGESSGSSDEPYIKRYAIDLTERAAQGKLDPVVGRDKEVTRVIRILSRKKKNNPVLVGPAGVGKTSIVEGLALRIHEKKVPTQLLAKKVFALDFALMIAGTMYRGQFEERLKKIVTEVKNNPDFIVFCDELHTIIGAGSAEGTMDASNILKPALARGEFTCVGATTLEEYRKYIERDSALERRFQKVAVDEPNLKDTISILKGAAKSYEKFHGVTYDDDVIESIATLSNRFINGRYQPDKGFDVMDEAGAAVKLSGVRLSEDKEKLQKKMDEVVKKKIEANAANDFDEIQKLKVTQEALQFRLDKVASSEKQEGFTVKIADIEAVVSAWTGIPVSDLSAADKANLVNLDKELSNIVIAQTEPIKLVAKSLKKYKTPFRDPNRPIGSFLFLGPTGVGKTMLARTLALKTFGAKDSILELDMSEYSESIAVTKLIGASAGYVGYDESAKLCKYVQQKPYSVILFDEIERAHPSVRELLLQVLENGRLTDNVGKIVDFRNAIVIMTSNLGVEAAKAMGFGSAKDLNERAKDNIMEEVKKFFKPEFLNRLQSVVFNPLTKEDARKVVDLEIGILNKRLEESKVIIKITKEAGDYIIANGFNEKFGARNVRTQIESQIEDALTEDFLKGRIPEKSVITFDATSDKLTYKIKGTK
jgi:ATP-dependent Clp protease ATP-binding subunit ClpC